MRSAPQETAVTSNRNRVRQSRRLAVLRGAMAAAALGVAVAYVALGARNAWDFETYYFAASADRAGLNPYSLKSLSLVAGRVVPLPYIYPPATLWLFAPFTLAPLEVASLIWLLLKCLLAGLLLLLWRRYLLPGASTALLLVVFLFGFDAASLWDLRTGNVSLLEGALLWVAFAAYLRGRALTAAVLIGLASCFKLTPVLFLALFLVDPRPTLPPRLPAVLGVLILAGLVGVPSPWTGSWAHSLATMVPGGLVVGGVHPSALGLLDAMLGLCGVTGRVARWLGLALYVIFASALLAASRAALGRARRSESRLDGLVLVILLWFALSPRTMIYSYALATAPVLFVILRRLRPGAGQVVAVSLLLMQAAVRFLPGRPPAWMGAFSLALILAAWFLWVGRPSAHPATATADCRRPDVST